MIIGHTFAIKNENKYIGLILLGEAAEVYFEETFIDYGRFSNR